MVECGQVVPIRIGDNQALPPQALKPALDIPFVNAEEFDAWESDPGLVKSLLPATLERYSEHPEREAERSRR